MIDIGTNWSDGNYKSSKDMIITISVLSSSAEGDEQHDGQKSNKYGQWLCRNIHIFHVLVFTELLFVLA